MLVTERLPKETAREYALRILKENIINLELAPGSMVSENELSAELGISRTPVREALIDLSKAQIVEIFPQKGSRVSLIDYSLVEEARFLRLVLETAIVELACSIADELNFTPIMEIIKLQKFYVENASPTKLLEYDNKFHEELFRLCNKSQTYLLIDSMTTHFDRVRSMSLITIKDIKIVEDHIAIIKAIQEKDVEAAKAVMTKHLSRYKIDKDVLRQKYPQYFK